MNWREHAMRISINERACSFEFKCHMILRLRSRARALSLSLTRARSLSLSLSLSLSHTHTHTHTLGSLASSLSHSHSHYAVTEVRTSASSHLSCRSQRILGSHGQSIIVFTLIFKYSPQTWQIILHTQRLFCRLLQIILHTQTQCTQHHCHVRFRV